MDRYYDISGVVMLRRRLGGGPTSPFDGQVEAGADDGYYEAVAFVPTASLIQTGDAAGTLREGWYRFTNVTIPQGATIDLANITLVPRATGGGVGTKTNLYMEDVDDAQAPVSRADVAGKTRTTAFAAWDDESLTANVAIDSPSITTVIKEIVDRGSWVSGNAMQILHDDNTSDAGKHYDFKSFENIPASACKLHVEWS